MVAKQIRFSEGLDTRAKEYAERLGISFNALVAVALDDYLVSKERIQLLGNPGDDQTNEIPQAVPRQESRPKNELWEKTWGKKEVVEDKVVIVEGREARRKAAKKGQKNGS